MDHKERKMKMLDEWLEGNIDSDSKNSWMRRIISNQLTFISKQLTAIESGINSLNENVISLTRSVISLEQSIKDVCN